MKWLLPDPNDPARNAPRLTPDVIDSATRPERGVERLGQRGRHHVLVHGAGDHGRLDAVGQPQHIILGAGLLRDVQDLAQQRAHRRPALMPSTLAHFP